jgi:hypothetical protein
MIKTLNEGQYRHSIQNTLGQTDGSCDGFNVRDNHKEFIS